MRFDRMALGAGAAVLLAATTAAVALARNPHCSGGILYVTQGMRDKDKGDAESYSRQMNKAVVELEQCTTQDADDFEALGYLGWAYAELDSAGPAGRAFAAAIKGLTAKGDKKKSDWATSNRNSYWARSFNEGINHIQNAQQAYAEFSKPPADETETTLKGEAERHYQEALVSLRRASLLKPGDPQTLRNLGSVHAFMEEFQKAEAVFQDGLKQAPGDSSLAYALKAVRVNYARSLVDAKKYDEAIAYFGDLLKSEPNNWDHYLSIGDAYFRRAQGEQGEARSADFKRAGDGYARAGELKPGDADLPFNAALAYQNAGVWDKAEAQWRLAVKLRPDDVEALSSLGVVLAEQKKFDEAIRTLHGAVGLKPQDKNLHRQFGAIYTKAGNNGKATEELMVYLAMQNGQPVADPVAAAKAAREGSAAARTLASDGNPDQVISWVADQDSYETWFYWAKKRAYAFKAGSLVTKSDWSVADTSVPSAGSGKK
ncbi:MAG: tetratricopeptide repeat protein [Candidatus Eisenbacteria bacterium]